MKPMKKTEQLNIRIDSETKEKLNALCKAEHRSQGNMISKLIREEFEKEE